LSPTEKYMFCYKNTASDMLKNNFGNGNLLVSSDPTKTRLSSAENGSNKKPWTKSTYLDYK